MVSLHTRRFVIVHLYSTFSVDPQNFPFGANLYKKLPFFCDFGGCKPTFFKAITVKFGMRIRTWDSVPKPNVVKKSRWRGPFWPKLYQKLPILAILGAVSALLKVTMVKFGVRVRTCDCLPMPKFVKIT